jgi:hypothetical protein
LVVPAARGPAVADEPFQVGKRLGDREAPLGRAEVGAEEVEGDLVGRAQLVSQGRGCLIQPGAMVRDQLARAAGGVVNRVAVARVDDPRRELDRALEGGEVVAERVGPAFGIEADRGRDLVQQVVAGDQHAVAQETEMAVRVARKLDDRPPAHLAALVEQVRIDRVADERRECMSLLD